MSRASRTGEEAGPEGTGRLPSQRIAPRAVLIGTVLAMVVAVVTPYTYNVSRTWVFGWGTLPNGPVAPCPETHLASSMLVRPLSWYSRRSLRLRCGRLSSMERDAERGVDWVHLRVSSGSETAADGQTGRRGARPEQEFATTKRKFCLYGWLSTVQHLVGSGGVLTREAEQRLKRHHWRHGRCCRSYSGSWRGRNEAG